MLVVAALGGNALLQRGQPLTADNQRANVRTGSAALANIVRAGHTLVVTHGNGPQVGLLALQGAVYKPDEAFPLDVLGAETVGMIGYMIEQELENALDHALLGVQCLMAMCPSSGSITLMKLCSTGISAGICMI